MSQIPINNNPKPPKRGERVMAKDIAELWQAVKRLAARQDTFRYEVPPPFKLPPLYVTLRKIPGDPVTWEVFTQYGHVVPRHNESAASGAPITIASLPTKDSPLSVVDGSKLWVKVDVDVYGKATGAAWETGASWPTDTPPELIGGDDQTGTAGERFVRIAEVIANPDSTTDPPQLMVEQLHTGHVDHFQPEICENTTTSPSGGEARVYKTWNASAGRHDFRYLTDGTGITITENADSIEVKANTSITSPYSHPWKVTNAGSGLAAIAAGYIHGYYLTYADASPGTPGSGAFGGGIAGPDSIVLGPNGVYAGGTTAITGTQYIYAEIDRSRLNEYSESLDEGSDADLLVELFDEVTPSFNQTAGIVVSSSAPDAYTPTTGRAAVCIAKVTNTAGTITVDAQYITHNPPLFLPVAAVAFQFP